MTLVIKISSLFSPAICEQLRGGQKLNYYAFMALCGYACNNMILTFDQYVRSVENFFLSFSITLFYVYNVI